MEEDAILVVISNEKDDDGFPVEKRKKFEVYIREKSVTRSEFYEAFRSGVNVQNVFEMRIEDWEQTAHMVNGKKAYATRIIHDGYEYEIVRAFKTDRSMVQVTCK